MKKGDCYLTRVARQTLMYRISAIVGDSVLYDMFSFEPAEAYFEFADGIFDIEFKACDAASFENDIQVDPGLWKQMLELYCDCQMRLEEALENCPKLDFEEFEIGKTYMGENGLLYHLKRKLKIQDAYYTTIYHFDEEMISLTEQFVHVPILVERAGAKLIPQEYVVMLKAICKDCYKRSKELVAPYLKKGRA